MGDCYSVMMKYLLWEVIRREDINVTGRFIERFKSLVIVGCTTTIIKLLRFQLTLEESFDLKLPDSLKSCGELYKQMMH